MKRKKYMIVIWVAILLLVLFWFYNKNRGSVTKMDHSQAENVYVEDFGANGEDSKDDSRAIQKAINFSKKSNIGKVKLVGNKNYIIQKGIVIEEGVELEFGQNTRLMVEGNFRVIEVEKNASISNGIIEIVDKDFDSDVIYLDGKQRFWSWERTQIQNVTIINSSNSHRGIGLHLYAAELDDYICFVNFTNINIAGFHTGVKLEAEKPQSNRSKNFINGNRFINLTLDDLVRGIDIDSAVGPPNESSGNIFSGLQIQISPSTEKVLTVNGSDNRFEGMIWDVQLLKRGNEIIEFGKESARNDFYSNLEAEYILDKGTQNYYSSPENKANQ
ncbi:hypothetical protein [Niallia oryzisoli]|uniref:hypothetical protein n=1 Tax=Niallia oryzisoli TaxID=1737571 RepID=UPI0037352E72